MVEFSKREGGNAESGSAFDAMSGQDLLARFYMRGLQPLIQDAQQILDSGDMIHEDRQRLATIVESIKGKVNELGNTKAGSKITVEDVTAYINKPREL